MSLPLRPTLTFITHCLLVSFKVRWSNSHDERSLLISAFSNTNIDWTCSRLPRGVQKSSTCISWELVVRQKAIRYDWMFVSSSVQKNMRRLTCPAFSTSSHPMLCCWTRNKQFTRKYEQQRTFLVRYTVEIDNIGSTCGPSLVNKIE